MNDELQRYLASAPHLYPHGLEERFPRVLNRIATIWRDVEAATRLFEDLLVDLRGDRQGFPPEIAREIFRLSVEHQNLLALPEAHEDVWAHERDAATAELDELGMRPHPTDMLRAAEGGDPDRLLIFLRAGLPVDARDSREWTPLMVAVFHGNEAAAKLLIEHGANPQARDRAGYTPLHWGALAGYSECVRLITRKAEVNVQSNAGITALLQAAAAGHASVCGVLLAAGGDANTASAEGWTPLHKAVANRHGEVVQLLVAAGASVSARHVNGATPLSLARASKDSKLVRLLLAAKQD